jgi:hypothetical protein
MTLNDAPQSDIVEVSLFGPGFGEGIAIHYGNGKWIVVDSCLNPDTERSVILEYLEQIRVDPTTSVTHIICTHAHDDHIKGLADVLEASQNARFAGPAAMTKGPFFALLATDERLEGVGRSSLREFRRIKEILHTRRNKPDRIGSYRYGIEGRTIARVPALGTMPETHIIALTPSDTAVTRALTKLAVLYPISGGKDPIKELPNEVSMAIWIEIGDIGILLGSDVLIGPTDCGWKGVIASGWRPTHRGEVYKVAHHGSHTGHYQPMWDQLLAPKPISILTPFDNGSQKLPTDDDLVRINALSRSTLFTARTKGPKLKGEVRFKTAGVSRILSNMSVLPSGVGHVRLRRSTVPGAKWTEDFVSPADRYIPASGSRNKRSKRGSKKERS